MLTESEARGTGVLTVTKMWGHDNTAKAVAQWYEYTLGSFLLGANGLSRMFFLGDGCTPHVCGSGASDLSQQPAPDLAIGNPDGAYTAAGNGTYTRKYDAGFVAVNPEKAAAKLTLPAGTWTNLDGDVVSGTDGVDVIHALGGNDHINGLGGDDILCGGTGNDKIIGGAGNDAIHGNGGADDLGGRAGDDTIRGGDERACPPGRAVLVKVCQPDVNL